MEFPLKCVTTLLAGSFVTFVRLQPNLISHLGGILFPPVFKRPRFTVSFTMLSHSLILALPFENVGRQSKGVLTNYLGIHHFRPRRVRSNQVIAKRSNVCRKEVMDCFITNNSRSESFCFQLRFRLN